MDKFTLPFCFLLLMLVCFLCACDHSPFITLVLADCSYSPFPCAEENWIMEEHIIGIQMVPCPTFLALSKTLDHYCLFTIRLDMPYVCFFGGEAISCVCLFLCCATCGFFWDSVFHFTSRKI